MRFFSASSRTALVFARIAPALVIARLSAAVGVVALAAACAEPSGGGGDQSGDGADLVLHNARVITMDDAVPDASALAIAGDRIVAVGSFDDVQPFVRSETAVHDLDGRTVIPGINETHIHVRDLGFERSTAVNLELARDIADVQRMLGDRLERLREQDRLGGWTYPTTGQTGDWLFGLGWTQDRLTEQRMADRHELDAVSRDVPISLTRIYNGVAVNTRVFELMGIDFDDPSTHPAWFREDPADLVAGDIIFRGDDGLPNGIFMGARAPLIVTGAIPGQSLEQRVESLTLAGR